MPRRRGADQTERGQRQRNGRQSETKEEKKEKRKKAWRLRERRLSDLFPWHNDKTARNATERGKRSDQELRHEERGEK